MLIRESLAAAGASDSPLYAAVRDQANLCGQALPETMRMTKAEVEMIRKQASAVHAPAPEYAAAKSLAPVLPAVKGQMMVLNPMTGQPI